jgi:hypothetical protein
MATSQSTKRKARCGFVKDPRPCLHCGEPFRPTNTQVRAGQGKYCSRACSYAHRTRSVAERLWEKADRSGGPDSCWLWQKFRTKLGYGTFCDGDGKTVWAHRAAWIITHGPIPEGLEVCHNCPGGDNPSCINPAHMFLGTRRENALDALAKGRTARGSRSGGAKLTEGQVITIRARYAAGGISQMQLSREYGVRDNLIHRIIKRKIWTHI